VIRRPAFNRTVPLSLLNTSKHEREKMRERIILLKKIILKKINYLYLYYIQIYYISPLFLESCFALYPKISSGIRYLKEANKSGIC